MKENNNQETKKNIFTGVSSAAGTVAGMIVEEAFTPHTAEAMEITDNILSDQDNSNIHDILEPETDLPTPHHVPHSNSNARNSDNNKINNHQNLSENEVDSPVEIVACESNDVVSNDDVTIINAEIVGTDPQEATQSLLSAEDTTNNDIDIIGVIEEENVSEIYAENILDVPHPTADRTGEDIMMGVHQNHDDLPDYVNDANINAFIDMA